MNYREVKCQDEDFQQTIKWILPWCCFHSFNVHVESDGPYDLDVGKKKVLKIYIVE